MLGEVFLFMQLRIIKLPKCLFLFILFISLVFRKDPLFQHNCPDCLEYELCEALENGAIQLHWFSRFLLMLNPKYTKSVFFARFNNTQEVVLKSITRRSLMTPKTWNQKLTKDGVLKILLNDSILSSDYDKNVKLCPSVKSLELLFKGIAEDLPYLLEKRKLWLDIQISIEPLLLKLFSVHRMPVPKLIGACGDVIVKEYIGDTLTKYYTSNWTHRIFLSGQLLHMAEAFTFSHGTFLFYFTDLSPDNIAVDSWGRTFLIDLDHVIIAERMVSRDHDVALLGSVHTSAVVDSLKLAVSPLDVCRYDISDHNFFAICKYVLLYAEETGQGLLENIPEEIHGKYPSLRKLLDECSSPKMYNNRISAGRSLQRVLREIASNFTWEGDS